MLNITFFDFLKCFLHFRFLKIVFFLEKLETGFSVGVGMFVLGVVLGDIVLPPLLNKRLMIFRKTLTQLWAQEGIR